MSQDQPATNIAPEAYVAGKPWTVRRVAGIVLKLLIVVLVLWFIRHTLVEAWSALRRRPLQIAFMPLLASGGLYLLGTFFCGLFWHRVLLTLGQKVNLWRTLGAYYVGHLGKYVPGKVMVVILRAGMISSAECNTALAVAAVFFETFTMMASGSFLAAAIVLFALPIQLPLVLAAIGVMITTLLPTLPPVFRWLVRRLASGRLLPEAADSLAQLDFTIIGLGWMLNLVGWAMLGLSYTAVLRAVGAGNFAQVHLHLAAVCLATVGGFISFLPAGAVVREAILAEMMVSQLGGATAVAAAVLLRLMWLMSELAVAGVVLAVGPLGGVKKKT